MTRNHSMHPQIRDMKELAQLGLALDPYDPNRVVPIIEISGSQKFDGQTEDALLAIAQRRYGVIVQTQVTLAVQFWHLGDVLEAIRKQHRHGRWLDFVKAQKWSYYRISTALRIRCQHETPESLNGLTVEEALGYDPRDSLSGDDEASESVGISESDATDEDYKDGDWDQTPEETCREIIRAIPWIDGELVLEPFCGDGSFLRNLPKCVRTDWCEIEKGRDFFQYNGTPDTIITNPPHRDKAGVINLVVPCLERCLQVAMRRVVFLVNDKTFSALTPGRLKKYEEWGWGITHLSVCSVKKWPGRYYVVIWEKGKPSIIGRSQAGGEKCGQWIVPKNVSSVALNGTSRGGPSESALRRTFQLAEMTHEERQRRPQATTLLHGEAVEKLMCLPDGIADVFLYDPPYPGIKRPYGMMTEEEWHALTERVLRESRRILKPTGSVVVIIQPNYERLGRMRLWPWEFVCRATAMWNDWGLIEDVYSFAPNALPGAGVKREDGLLRKSVKWCVWLGRPDCYRNQDAVLQEPCEATIRRYTDDRLETFPSGAKVCHETFRRAMEDRGGVTPFNFLTIPTGTPIDQHGHPAATPYRLAEWWCRYILPPGGVLIDPFCGSGTTLLAALNCGASQVIGIDKEASYVEIARRRILGEIPIADQNDGQQITDITRESLPAHAG